ncbi:MAG: ABC transporter ATP-binding protein [Deltaproteobacteria bacterium]|uniref:ABC transporter ATP-binding protein n=1 Tax=Candidatus Zymogenus saltonus TaxID=2844893 RepID=A0A9D8KFQ1_9DELT|nr:ABC transporter ATP-binding protein [Candidatus Zymogenus saltonus]
MEREEILSVKSLTKLYGGVVAVNNVSFEIKEGEILSLIGPNGAGKTTIFNCMTGLSRPTKGEISLNLNGKQSVISARKKMLKPDAINYLGIARTFQNIRLFNNLTILNNVKIGRHSRSKKNFAGAVLRTRSQKLEEKDILKSAVKYIVFVGLEGSIMEIASNLPYGAQRRLEIARALATEPKLLLLDEPAAGMNPKETGELMNLIRRIRDMGITVLIIEHDMKVVMEISDRIVVLEYGKKIADGNPIEIKNSPAVIKAYLGTD